MNVKMQVIDLVHLYNKTDEYFWLNISECVNSTKVELNISDSNETFDENSIVKLCVQQKIGSSPYVPLFSVKLFWSLLYASMIASSAIGNSLVIWIILAHKKMRTVTNLFLLNLAIADMMMALFNANFNFIFMLNSHWPFGQTYCKINNSISNLTVFASVFTITAMSFDR
ncbi:tachykinin-like peptides receptor 86C [Dinothrombium tinctorium]|uniref:Tachykinin-like peptides receptor 86C n=1 Tax=Dinothrombium tinctorium TaxID=1965070 RepID=A0A443RH46_9ACAR|nr:tachykinin-like peptides receptor 86C [Dinothrombium tinctorium]